MVTLRDNTLQNSRAKIWLALLAACLVLIQCGDSKQDRLNLLVALANGGDRQAQFKVARRYETGNGFLKDPEKAKKWYLEAAGSGLVQAQYRLAQLISGGQSGRQSDQKEAAFWFQQAAVQGHVDAQLQMSRRYLQGNGTDRDANKSVAWLRRAARRGHPRARDEMASLYLGGSLPHRNDSQAVVLIHQLGQLSIAEYEALLGWMYAFGIGVPLHRDTAMAWLQKANNHGSNGVDFLLDQFEGRRLAVPSSGQLSSNHPEPAVVRYPIHVLYGDGSRIPADEEELLQWYRVQATAGHPPAQFDLAWCYTLGIGIEPDKARALSWFKRAADQKYLPAELAITAWVK